MMKEEYDDNKCMIVMIERDIYIYTDTGKKEEEIRNKNTSTLP